MTRKSARELVLHITFLGEHIEKSGQELLDSFITEENFVSLADEYELYKTLPDKSQRNYIHDAVKGVVDHSDELNEYIVKYSVGWKFNRIAKITRSILKLCMYEIKYMNIPPKASVNEALELAKSYDSEEAKQFINGIMASFLKDFAPDLASTKEEVTEDTEKTEQPLH